LSLPFRFWNQLLYVLCFTGSHMSLRYEVFETYEWGKYLTKYKKICRVHVCNVKWCTVQIMNILYWIIPVSFYHTLKICVKVR
jgi:hypothetical protein